MACLILAGDIGGTHTRLAFFENGKKIVEKKFSSRNYSGLEPIVREFIELEKKKASKACFGVAGVVRNGKCKVTNLPWLIDADALSKTLEIPAVRLLNDLEANAYALRVLQKEELELLQKGDQTQKGNQLLISMGTGLGQAGLFWDGVQHFPFASEGGHSDFAPRNEEEIALFLYLKKKLDHVSCERVLSGPGLHLIFQFLIDTGRASFSLNTKEEMSRRDPSVVISDWGSQRKDVACSIALDLFIAIYGAEVGNAALKFMSLGGVYLGGGIAPRIIEKLKEGSFLASFLAKGRFKELLESMPVWLVLNEDTTLRGVVAYTNYEK